ncbi:MAG TPA: nitrite reductase small subunit NirD [Pseudonocardiaceae bacterium]|jgi:nitrite reductase (NADH) small subunit
MTVVLDTRRWVGVCPLARLQPERGVAVLLAGDVQVALFRTLDGTGDAVYAVHNIDPFTGAAVLSRGIVGDRAGVPTVASPLYKQVFDLTTGRCFDDPAVVLTTYPVRVVDGEIEVGLP